MKKIYLRLLTVTLLIILIVVISLLTLSIFFPESKKYDENSIVGNDISSIIEKYGDFDKIFYDKSGNIGSGWYTINEREPLKIGNFIKLGMREAKYQVICFENNIAVKTYVRIGTPGG